ncbi:MAG: dockerin type I repeat-containing protein, partial [Prevotella sp.]|nr:dockerin type I repeat-containing protein [Prevotella sp.]
GTPLEGATVLTLDNATFERNTLTLNFQETTTMEPGKPYLIKWAEDSEHPTIANPVFNNVVISNTSTTEKAVVAGFVSFKGHYAPMNIGQDGNPNILYLGDDNTFHYANGAMDINAFRAYFDANTKLGDVNGDGTTNVTDVTLMVDYILGKEVDDSFLFENADITRDGIISVTDVTALTDIILGGNSIVKMVVNGAEGITFDGGGNGPARTKKIED